MATPVIFRKWPKSEGGDVIALFPAFLGSNDVYTCLSYEHVGQHGGADPVGVIQRTKSATPAEYANLKKELENLGYDDLVVYSRLQSSFLETRKKEMAGIAAQHHDGIHTTRRKKARSTKRSPTEFGGVR